MAKQIFERYGYPGYDKVGKDSENNFWFYVQHSDHDLPFQLAVLKKMKKAVAERKADPFNFAFFNGPRPYQCRPSANLWNTA